MRLRSIGLTEPAHFSEGGALGKRVNRDQALQLNRCNVPESPCHWRSLGSDQRLPLLLAKSMLGN